MSVVFVAALFMSLMDVTIVNVAVPTIGHEFRTKPAAVDSVVIGYLVSLAVFMPVSGWLGDRYGGKRVLLTAIVVFTFASAMCGTATSLGELVMFRVLQGAGGGLMAPVGMAMLFRVFPPADRVRVSSILIIPSALAPALGPVLGGLFVTHLSWRWVFFVNAPVGILAAAFGAIFLANRRSTPADGPFDLCGFLLAGGGFGCLMYGVSEGPVRGWSNGAVLVCATVGTIMIVVLVAVERRVEHPMLALTLYQDRLFRAAGVVMALSTFAFFSVLYLAVLFFQNGLRLTALQSGLNTFPEALGIVIGSQLVTRFLYPRLGPRRIMVGAAAAVAVAISLLALVDAGTSLWTIRAIMLLLGFSQSGVLMSAQVAAFATVSHQQTGRASTLFNAQRQLAGAVGVAV